MLLMRIIKEKNLGIALSQRVEKILLGRVLGILHVNNQC